MKKLKISSLYDNLHFLAILIILLILTLKYWYFIFLLIIYLIFIYKKTSLFKIGVFLSLLIILSSIRYYIKFEDKEFYGTVIECNETKATILSNLSKIIIYHKGELTLGEYGYFKVMEADYDSDLFNYSEYLLNKGIKNYYKLNSFKLEENRFVLGKIKKYIIDGIDDQEIKYSSYIKALILADKSELEIYEETQNLGISHLIAVSGMHISLLVFFIMWILKKIFYFEKPVDIIVIIFLLCYLVITNFELTVLRATLMVVLSKIFKYKKWNFTSLDILSIIAIFLLLINPRSLFLLSFELSFMVSFIIIIFGKNFEIKNKFLNTFVISLIAFITTLPFIINTNYEINLLSILIGPLYVLYFELILYPLTIFTFIIPPLMSVFECFFAFFESSVHFFDCFNVFKFIFGELSPISFIIYEVILYFLLTSFEIKRGRVIFTILYLMFLLLIYNKELFNPNFEFVMFDVGQGDSFLIKLPHQKGNILIDCYNNVDKYLKKEGVKNIDIVFLSHGHSDHIGAYSNLISSFKINKTYSSFYDNTDELNELKRKYDISLLKSGDYINFKEFRCEVLGPLKYYENENNNSLVLKVMLLDITILFTGDIEKEAETDLVKKYNNNLKCDILKASHHGSLSSSCREFLDCAMPDVVLISVGKNNLYGFPNNKHLLLHNGVYRSDRDGCVRVVIRKNYFHIRK